MKTPKTKRIATLFLLGFFVISSSLFYFPLTSLAGKIPPPDTMKFVDVPPKPKAASDCFVSAGIDFLLSKLSGLISEGINKGLKYATFGLLGDVQKVEDDKAEFQITKRNVQACIDSVSQTLFKLALVKFQKQLLDRITDDTIAWINGDNPKYFTDFGKLFTDSANSALGDTLSDVLGTNVCAPFKFNLTLGLTQRQTPFTRQVSCTLDQVVGNIDAFQQNFSAGGWVGYSESLKPQNNYFGALFLTQQEIMAKENQNEKVAQAQLATSPGGIKSVEKCVQWTAILKTRNGDIKIPDIPYAQGYDDPNIPPPKTMIDPDLRKQYSDKGIIGSWLDWSCEKKSITVPSQISAAVTAKAVTSDTDYLVHAGDLAPYVNAIFDAAINRLTKAGVEGLKSAFINSDSGSGRPPTPYDPNKDKYIIQGGKNYNNSSGNTSQKDSLKEKLKDLIATSTTVMAEAKSLLKDVSDINLDLSDTKPETVGSKLSACEIQRFGPLGLCQNTSSTIVSANERIRGLSSEEDQLKTIVLLIDNAEKNMDALSENELFSVLSSLSESLSVLKARIESLKTLKSDLESTQKDFTQSLDQCGKTYETYVCKQ